MSKIANDGLPRSGTGYLYPYGNSGRQSAKYFILHFIERFRGCTVAPCQTLRCVTVGLSRCTVYITRVFARNSKTGVLSRKTLFSERLGELPPRKWFIDLTNRIACGYSIERVFKRSGVGAGVMGSMSQRDYRECDVCSVTSSAPQVKSESGILTAFYRS